MKLAPCFAVQLFVCCAIAAYPGAASSQTIYQCVQDGKVTYSGTPCPSTEAKRIATQAGPTAEDQLRAQDRLRRGLSDQSAQETLRSATTNRSNPSVAQARQPNGAPAPDPHANEKVLLHDSTGWDYKTRGQIEAEDAARAGRPVSRTGAAWETERPLTYGPDGWSKESRLSSAKARGEALRRQDQLERESAAGIGHVFIDQFGRPWINQGGTALNPSTGKVCPHTGPIVSCP